MTQSSMYRDRVIKAPIYGENRAPEYWIVDLEREVVIVHTQPSRSGYKQVEAGSRRSPRPSSKPSERRRGTLRPVKLPDVSIALADIPWSPRPPKRGKR